MTFTLDSRKFEYVDQQDGGAGTSSKAAKVTKEPDVEESNPPAGAVH